MAAIKSAPERFSGSFACGNGLHHSDYPALALPFPFVTGFSSNAIGGNPSFTRKSVSSFAARSGLSFKNCFEFSRP